MEPGVSSWKDHPQKYFGKVQVTLPWKSIQLIFPHRVRRRLRSKLRSRVSPASSISTLQTSFSPFDTLKSLQAHRWSVYDGQYLILIVLGVFSLCIIESPGPLAKTMVALGLIGSLLFPATCQFFLPFLPIACWLIFFYACGYVLTIMYNCQCLEQPIADLNAIRSQIHSKRLAPSNLGSRSTSPRKYLLRSQSQQYPLRSPKHLSGYHGLASVWDHALRSPIRLLSDPLLLWATRHNSRVRSKLWLHEHHCCHHTVPLPMLTTMV